MYSIKSRIGILCCAFVAIVSNVQTSFAQVTNTDTSTNYSTIQAAIDAATPGDTLSVSVGTYSENLTLSKSLTILGPQSGVCATGRTPGDASEAIIDFSGSYNGIVITASDVTVDGFEIVGDADTGKGIYVAASDNDLSNIDLINNIIHGMGRENTSNSSVACYGILTDAKASASGPFGTISELTIDCNDFFDIGGVDNGGGIYSQGLGVSLHEIEGASPGATVTNNRFTNMGDGFDGVSPAYGTGVFVGEKGLPTSPSSDVMVMNNTYADSTGGVAIFATSSSVDEDHANFSNVPVLVLNIGNFATINEANLAPYAKSGSLTGFPGSTGYFAAIKDAVAGSDAGATIDVTSGTFVESGQVEIDKDLTIIGDAGTRPVIMTDSNTATNGDGRGMWLVDPGVELHLSDLVFDGSGRLIWQGIRHKGSGTITNCTFRQMMYSAMGSPYAGTGVAAFGGPVDFTDCDMEDIGRIGIQYFGAGVSGSQTTGFTYTGKGSGDFLDYAFDIGNGAQVTLSQLDVSECRGVASSDGSTSAGVLVTTFFGPGTSATIENSFINDNSTGVFVGYDSSDTATAFIHGNDLSQNDSSAVRNTSSTVVVDASGNWYGDSDPAVVASSVDSMVDYTPWLDSGTDTDGATAGFQGDFSVLDVDDDSPQTGASTRIQEGIDLVSGSTVNVLPGTYPGNISVTGDVTLQSTGGAASTTIAGAGGCAVSIDGDDVTIDGFTVTNPTGTNAICANDQSNIAIRNNIVTNVGGTTVGGNHHAVLITSSSSLVNNVTIEDNDINSVTGSETGSPGSASAITVGFSNGNENVTGLTIQNNTISNINAYTIPYASGGRGAYGILINHGTGTTGMTVAPQVLDNTISDLEGRWAHGIGLEGNTPNALVQGNHVSNLTDHKATSDAIGVQVEANASADTIEISYNFFTNMNVGVQNVSGGTTVNAEHNYWGSDSGPFDPSIDMGENNDIDYLSCTGDPASEFNSNGTGSGVNDTSSEVVDYCPWLLGQGKLVLENDQACPDDAVSGASGYQVAIELWMRELQDPATGYQAFVTYDTMKLTYRGDLSSYSGSPYSDHITSTAGADHSGVLWLDGFEHPGGGMGGTTADSRLATLVFDVAASCTTTSLDFDTSYASELSFEGNPLITGNQASPTITLDDDAPTITPGPFNSCYPTAAAAEAAALATTMVNDNCTAAPSITAEASGTCSATVTVTAVDDCGNVATYVYNTRIDNEPPVVTPTAIAACYDTQGNAEAAAMSEAMLNATDNCTTMSGDLSYTVVETSGSCNATITVRVQDECGNYTDVQYTTHIDNTPPSLITGTILDCYPTAAAAESDAIDATMMSDNCPAALEISTTTVGTCNAMVTVTVTDFCDNSSSTSYNTRIDNEPPVVTCSNVSTPADAGDCTASVILSATAFDNCDMAIAGVDIDFIVDSDHNGIDGSDPVIMGSGTAHTFSSGDTAVRAVAQDSCGNVGTCDFTVSVEDVNVVNVDVVLDAVTYNGSRYISFTLKDTINDICAPAECRSLMFAPMGGDSVAHAAIALPCGNWDAICAKDVHHTLIDSVSLTVSGTEYFTTGDLVLLSGDTDNDSDVDINDVTLFIAQFGTMAPAGSDACPYNNIRDADFSLNGTVSGEDFSILQPNWLMFSSCGCPAPITGDDDTDDSMANLRPVDTGSMTRLHRLGSITLDAVVTRLDTRTLSQQVAIRADLDRDGEITFKDIRIFEDTNGFDHNLSDSLRQVETMKSNSGSTSLNRRDSGRMTPRR